MQRQRQEQQEQQQRDALFGPNPRRDDARSPASRGSYNDDSERNAAEGEAGGVPSYGGSQSWSGQHEQRQQLTWAQVRDRIDVNERRRGLRSAHESAETGRAALESLQDQKERLERSEMVLDSTRYAIERSVRVLRGMNFWGKIRNAFTDDPQIPESYNNRSGGVSADDTPAEGFICPDCRRSFHTADGLVAHFESEHGVVGGSGGGGTESSAADSRERIAGQSDGGLVAADTRASWDASRFDFNRRVDQEGNTSPSAGGGGRQVDNTSGNSLREQLFGRMEETSRGGRTAGARRGSGVITEQKAVIAAQDAYLDEVGRAVTELGLLGRNIGTSIDEHGEVLERVFGKTDESNDRAAFVTRKAARQAQSAKPKKPTFVMSLALQEISTGLFISVTGEDVILRGTDLRNVCRFEAWQRQDGIIGFKSRITGRWLGQTFLGYLRVTGASFSKNYEWQANLHRKETTMICCSANWGAGGYLSTRPVSQDTTTTPPPPPATTSPASDSGCLSSTPAVPVTKAEICLVDATLANRSRAALFRVINCEGYVAQPYVSGRLMRPPQPPDGNGSVGGSGGK